MQVNNVFKNVKERTINEMTNNRHFKQTNKGKKAAIVVAHRGELNNDACETFKKCCEIAEGQGFEILENGGEFWCLDPVSSLDNAEYSRMIMKLAPAADAIYIDDNVYNELDYIEQRILVAGMKLINIEIREAQSGYMYVADPIYEHEIQRALANRVAISPMAKDPNVRIAGQAILYELVVVMSNIWKCVRVGGE